MAIETIGPYRLLKEYSGDSGAQVYLARDAHLNCKAVVDIVDLKAPTTDTERFLTEAERLEQLNDPRIARYYDSGHEEGLGYLARKPIVGVTLPRRVDPQPVETSDVIELGSQLTEAIATLHDAGVVCNGLTPSNVIIGPNDRVRLADFGVASVPGTTEVVSAEHPSFARPMTRLFWSPEQLNFGTCDQRSDLFSLGAILFFLSTGHLPPDALSSESATTQHRWLREIIGQLSRVGLIRPHVSPDLEQELEKSALDPRIKPALSQLICQLMAEQPRARPESAEAALEELRRLGRVLQANRTSDSYTPPTAHRDAEQGIDHDTTASVDRLAEVGPKPVQRYVRMWFDSEEQVPPLRVGQWYTFKFNIVPNQAQRDSSSVPLAEPDFGGRDELDLLLSLFSEDFDVKQQHHPVVLPRVGPTEVLQTRLKPRHSDMCRIEIIVSLAKELAILQELEVTVQVADASAPIEKVV